METRIGYNGLVYNPSIYKRFILFNDLQMIFIDLVFDCKTFA